MADLEGSSGKVTRVVIGAVVAGILAAVIALVLLTGTFQTTQAPQPEESIVLPAGGVADNLDVGNDPQLPPQAPLDLADLQPTPEPTPVPTEVPAPPQAPVAVPTRAAVVLAATPVPPAPPAAPVALSSMEQDMFNMHNSERARAGLGSLRIDGALTQIARQRAQDMASRNYFSHTSPTGGTAFTLMSSSGYRFISAGENIARNNYPDNQATQVAMTGFMNSADHRENILDRSFNYVGVGLAYGADGMKYYAVEFAAR